MLRLEIAPLAGVPIWRREPYRLLFPLGVAISFVAVGQWLVFAAGVTPYRPIFHAMAQVQGFVACFIAGFLLTFLPRRTAAAPPSAWQMVVALVCPVGLTVAAWYERWGLSQVFYLAMTLMLLHFMASRLLRSRSPRPVDDNLIWVPLSLGLGAVASVVTGVAAARGEMWLHDIGRGLVLQGVVAGLVVGVGGMLVPVITRGEPPRTPSLRGKLFHAALFTAFVSTFFVEGLVSQPLGLLARGAVALLALGLTARLWRLPTRPGLNGWLVWLAAWCVPLGFVLAGLFPEHRAALIHVVFVGGFALLVFSVGTHVVLSHANQPGQLSGAPLALKGVGALMGAALTMRLLLELDPTHYFWWMSGAAAAFVLAGACWVRITGPWLVVHKSR